MGLLRGHVQTHRESLLSGGGPGFDVEGRIIYFRGDGRRSPDYRIERPQTRRTAEGDLEHPEPVIGHTDRIYIRYSLLNDSAMENTQLLLKFRDRDTRYGVTRSTVKSLAAELQVSETQVVHLALSKLAEEVLPAYQPDDGPLTAAQLNTVRKLAKTAMPVGKVIAKQSLF